MKINDFADAVKTKPNKANFKRDLAWLKMDLAMPYRKVKDANDTTIDAHGGWPIK